MRQALFLDNGGNTSRDFIFVEDLARGLMACALKGKAGEIYNLATGKETTILQLATIINEYTGNTVALELKPAREWDRSENASHLLQKPKNSLIFRQR